MKLSDRRPPPGTAELQLGSLPSPPGAELELGGPRGFGKFLSVLKGLALTSVAA
jgi:hypothetical protein